MVVGKKTSKIQQAYDNRSQQSIQYAIGQIKQSPVQKYVLDVILFGSCARKEQTYQSDVDLLLVLSPYFHSQHQKEDVILLKSAVTPLNRDLPEVDLKVVVGTDWETDSSLFFSNIRKDGISVW